MRLIALFAPLALAGMLSAQPTEQPLPSIPDLNMDIFEPTANPQQEDLPALAIHSPLPPEVQDVQIRKTVEIEVVPNVDATLGFLVVPANETLPDAESILTATNKNGIYGTAEGKAQVATTFQVDGLQKQELYRYGVAGQKEGGNAVMLKKGFMRLGEDPAETPLYPEDTTQFTWQLKPGAWNMVSIPNGLNARENAIASNVFISSAFLFDSDTGFVRLSKYETRYLDSGDGLFVFATSDAPESGVTIQSAKGEKLRKLSEAKKEWSGLSPNKWFLLGVPHAMSWPKLDDSEIKKPFDGCPTFDLYYFDANSNTWNQTSMIPSSSAIWLIHRCVE